MAGEIKKKLDFPDAVNRLGKGNGLRKNKRKFLRILGINGLLFESVLFFVQSNNLIGYLIAISDFLTALKEKNRHMTDRKRIILS